MTSIFPTEPVSGFGNGNGNGMVPPLSAGGFAGFDPFRIDMITSPGPGPGSGMPTGTVEDFYPAGRGLFDGPCPPGQRPEPLARQPQCIAAPCPVLCEADPDARETVIPTSVIQGAVSSNVLTLGALIGAAWLLLKYAQHNRRR